jgi:predicted ATP-grasp superfamily ATP-dependent carboligase
MQVFISEHITGGGLLSAGDVPGGSLLREGLAMLTALAQDMAGIDDVHVAVTWDHRLPPVMPPQVEVVEAGCLTEERQAFRRLAAGSDWTVAIAPEFDGILLDRCRGVEDAGGRLLGPRPDLVELAADKHATVEHLAAAGIPAPRGVVLKQGEALPRDFTYPAVLKPRDGAGSQDVRLVGSADEIACAPWPARLEEFCSGHAASVAVLGGRSDIVALEPCRQDLSGDGRFAYRGGSLPLPRAQALRATRLARRVARALPSFIGYVGIDLVLGAADDGSNDCVIEVNPRLTTSYVGLRVAAEQNLAAIMLELAKDGSSCPPPSNVQRPTFNVQCPTEARTNLRLNVERWTSNVQRSFILSPCHPPSPQGGEGGAQRALVTWRPEALAAGIVFDSAGNVRLGERALART